MRRFNSTGPCVSAKHYMVDTSDRVAQMRTLVDQGNYFYLNLPSQYGTTTMLWSLSQSLQEDYTVVNLLLCGMSEATYRSESTFVRAFAKLLLDEASNEWLSMPNYVEHTMRALSTKGSDSATLSELFKLLRTWMSISELPIVLILDELYLAPRKQVFLDFLAQLRAEYLHNVEDPLHPVFQSVILTGTTDMGLLDTETRPEEQTRPSGPWNIAVDFDMDMSCSVADVEGMLADYEADHATGMDGDMVATEIIAWTGGYPYLVSRICQLVDERGFTWDCEGISRAVSLLRTTCLCITDLAMWLIQEHVELKESLRGLLMRGEEIDYSPYDKAQRALLTYGFARLQGGRLVVANRYFETLLLDLFLHEDAIAGDPFYRAGCLERSRCVVED